MTDEIKKEEEVKDTTSVSETEQDPLKTELEKVQKTGKTEKEKAAFTLKKVGERARELGIDPAEVLDLGKSTTNEDDEDDDKPVTRGEMKRMQREQTVKTALQLADEISNETERELTKYHLQNTIKSTGNPQEDLKNARSLVNAAKNGKIIEEFGRKGEAKTHSNGSGVDAVIIIDTTELTSEESKFLGKPFNMTKEQIIKARPKK